MIAPMQVGGVRIGERPLIMGVVNVTPDSFSDGGRYVQVEAAVEHGRALAAAGADILDVGGEATNPRAQGVSAEEELRRVLPVIEGLRGVALLSVDTTKAEVARAAIEAGAEIVNDVAGGRFDAAMFEVVAESGAAYVCGHLRGASLAEVFASEGSVAWEEVAEELAGRLDAMPAGLRERTIVDPGLGFGKGDHDANVELIARCGDLSRTLGRPVMVGPSRKRFVAKLLGATRPETDMLDAGTVGACLAAVNAGAHVLRTHHVSLLRAALVVYTEIERARRR
ncbi:MAG TPA: dihydropteroate synthase [Kofleriaceae bacterium]|nr:dihydropteroate synthase [Kofleriaceae bacterium]